MKVIHVMAGLSVGGAEAMLFRLCTQDTGCQHVVISLSSEGKYGSLLCMSRGLKFIPLVCALIAFALDKLILLLRKFKLD